MWQKTLLFSVLLVCSSQYAFARSECSCPDSKSLFPVQCIQAKGECNPKQGKWVSFAISKGGTSHMTACVYPGLAFADDSLAFADSGENVVKISQCNDITCKQTTPLGQDVYSTNGEVITPDYYSYTIDSNFGENCKPL